jgi:hypothetical protein
MPKSEDLQGVPKMSDELLKSLGQWVRDQRDDESKLGLPPEPGAAADPAKVADALRPLLQPLDPSRKQQLLDKLSPPIVRLPARPPRPLWVRRGAAIAALAAALALLLTRLGLAPAPEYKIEWWGGLQQLRAIDTSAPIRLSPSSPVKILLTPATPVSQEVGLRASLAPSSSPSAPVALTLAAQKSEEGAILIQGRSAELFGERSGEWELVLVIGVSGQEQSFRTRIRFE